MKSVRVFDLCGTLYRDNTTFGMLRSARPIYSFFIFSFVMRLFSKVVRFILGVDLIRILAIYGFKGFSKAELYQVAENYYNDVLENKKNPYIHCLFDQKENDTETIISSASIDPIVATVAEMMGASKYTCSRLEYVNNVCTGRLEFDNTGGKEKLIEERISLAVTDNASDIGLVKSSDRAVLLVGEASYRFWKKNARSQDSILVEETRSV